MAKSIADQVRSPSAATMAVLTGGIVVLGKWSNKEKLDIKLAIGIAGYAIGLSVLSEILPKVAEQLSWIVALTVGFTYGHILAYNAELTDIFPRYATAVGIKVKRR
jgi:hypothetical protein